MQYQQQQQQPPHPQGPSPAAKAPPAHLVHKRVSTLTPSSSNEMRISNVSGQIQMVSRPASSTASLRSPSPGGMKRPMVGTLLPLMDPNGKVFMVPPSQLIGKKMPSSHISGSSNTGVRPPVPSAMNHPQSLSAGQQMNGKELMPASMLINTGARHDPNRSSFSVSDPSNLHAPLTQQTKMQVAAAMKMPHGLPGQVHSEKRMFNAPAKSPVSNISEAENRRAQISSNLGHTHQTPTQNFARLESSTQNGSKKPDKATSGLLNSLKNTLGILSGKDSGGGNKKRVSDQRTPQMLMNAKSGVVPQQLGGSTGTTAGVTNHNLGANMRGPERGQVLEGGTLSRQSTQNQQLQQQQQQAPSTKFLIGDNVNGVSQPNNESQKVLAPVLATEVAATGALTAPKTPSAQEGPPLVVSPAVHLRDEAGEAGIAPTVAVQVTRDDDEGNQHSLLSRRVLKFPSLLIVDTDSDSDASTGVDKIEKKSKLEWQTAVSNSAVQGPLENESCHTSTSALGVQSLVSSSLVAQRPDSIAAVDTVTTNKWPHSASGHCEESLEKRPSPILAETTMKETTEGKMTLQRETPSQSILTMHSQAPLAKLITATTEARTDIVEPIDLPRSPIKQQKQHQKQSHSNNLTSKLLDKISSVVLENGNISKPEKGQGQQHRSCQRQQQEKQQPNHHSHGTLLPKLQQEIPSLASSKRPLTGELEKPQCTPNPSDVDNDDSKTDPNFLPRDSRTTTPLKARDNGRLGRGDRSLKEGEDVQEQRASHSPSCSLHSEIFHNTDVYKLYQELRRQQSQLRRERFYSWRQRGAEPPESHRSTNGVDGQGMSTKKCLPRPWRSSSFNPSPLPFPSPLRRRLGYINLGNNQYRCVARDRRTSGNNSNRLFASGSQRISNPSLILSPTTPNSRCISSPSPERRPYFQSGPSEYLPPHPYEVVSFLLSPRPEDRQVRKGILKEGYSCINVNNGGRGTYGDSSDDPKSPVRRVCKIDRCNVNSPKTYYKVRSATPPVIPLVQDVDNARVTPNNSYQPQRSASGPLPVQINGSLVTPIDKRSSLRRGSKPTVVLKNRTVRGFRRCCSEGDVNGEHICTSILGVESNISSSRLDKAVSLAFGGEDVKSSVALAGGVGRVSIPVVDLRKDFKPRLDTPLKLRRSCSVPKSHVGNGVKYERMNHSSKSDSGRTNSSTGSMTSRSRQHIRQSTTSRCGVESVEKTTQCLPQRSAVNRPPFSPHKLYSSFEVKEPGRPSAWALGPERRELLANSPRARRRIVQQASIEKEHCASAFSDKNDVQDTTPSTGKRHNSVPVILVEEVRLDEQRRPYVLIREVPCGAAAVAAQRNSVQRLSRPRPVFVSRDSKDGEAM